MKKILICSTILSTVSGFLIPHIRLLQELGYSIDVAGYKDINELDNIVNNVYDIPFQRTPFSKLNISASRKLKEIVSNNGYNMIHFHTPVASAFGRWTVRNYRKFGTKVFYTAHGFHFFKGAPLKNWLFYYPVERWLARYTDVLLTMNKEDYDRAKSSFKAGKIEYIPGVGIDITKFSEAVVDRSSKRKELDLPDDAVVVLSVGELSRRKNHETVIKAIGKINNKNVYYIISGDGVLVDYLEELVKKLSLEKQVKLLGHRRDIDELNKASDVFAFPSFQEGLPVALMEAMAAGLPVVCSRIRGNIDLIEQDVGGYLCAPDDIDGFAEAISKLAENTALRQKMCEQNLKSVNKYDFKNIQYTIRDIYQRGLFTEGN